MVPMVPMARRGRRSPWLTILAAISLGSWIAVYGLIYWYAPIYRSSCGPGDDMCGLALVGPFLFLLGIAIPTGLVAALGGMVRAARRRDVLSALAVTLLLLVTCADVYLMAFNHITPDTFADAASWAEFVVVTATVLAFSVTHSRAQHLGAAAGLALAAGLLVAITVVG